MSKWLRLSVLVGGAMLMASIASAEGLNLLWNECALGSGVQNKTFACNTNSGSNALYASYIPPAGITAATGIEVVCDLLTEGLAVPDWWAFKNLGTCRSTALGVTADFTSNTACTDYWVAQATPGISAYSIGFAATANRARIIAIAAVAPANAGPLDSANEYYAVRFNISNAKTVGAGALSCAGCSNKVCIVLNSIKVTQPVGVGNFVISAEATSRTATWQGELASTCLPVPARNTTWGAVKSLYR